MIFHADKRNGFVMVERAALHDPNLSLKAKGLLCYLLSKPPDWRPQIADICNHCREGERAVQAALKELEGLGYAQLVKERHASGRLSGSYWAIFERPPQNLQKGQQITENAVFRLSVKSPLSNTRKSTYKVFGDFENFPPDNRFSPEQIAEGVKGDIERVLKLPKGSPFLAEWEARGRSAPWRTMFAIEQVEEQVLSGVKIKDRSAKANWYFLNYDLKTRLIPKNHASKRFAR